MIDNTVPLSDRDTAPELALDLSEPDAMIHKRLRALYAKHPGMWWERSNVIERCLSRMCVGCVPCGASTGPGIPRHGASHDNTRSPRASSISERNGNTSDDEDENRSRRR